MGAAMGGFKGGFGLMLAAAIVLPSPVLAAEPSAALRQKALTCFPGAPAVRGASADGWAPLSLPLQFLSLVGVTAYDAPVPVRIIYAGDGEGLAPGFTQVVKATRDADGRWQAIVVLVPPPSSAENGVLSVHRRSGHFQGEQNLALDRLAADQCLAATPTQPAAPHCRDETTAWLEVRTPSSAWTGRVRCADLGASGAIAGLIFHYAPAVAAGS